MGLLSKSSASGSGSSKGVVQAPGSAAEGGKFSYSQYVEGGKGPSQSALSTAASYKRGPTAALQVQLESSRQRSQRLSGSSGFPEQPPLDSAVCRPARLWMHCLSLMQVAVAVALIAVVASCLNRQEKMAAPVDEQGASLPASYSVCYATTRSTNLCWYSYWAAAASIAVSLLISVMQFCCPRRRQALCLSLEALLGLLGAAWWLASGITELVLANEADYANLPHSSCRTATWILCFVNAGLFSLSFVTSACGCCRACGPQYGDDDLLP